MTLQLDNAARASLARDARLLKELQTSEAWQCVEFQLDKMEAQVTDALVREAQTTEQMHYWRGRFSAIRDLKRLPDVVMGYAKMAGVEIP